MFWKVYYFISWFAIIRWWCKKFSKVINKFFGFFVNFKCRGRNVGGGGGDFGGGIRSSGVCNS